MVNLVAVQMNSVPNVDSNILWLERLFELNPIETNSIIVLPECFSYFGGKDKTQLAIAETAEGGAVAERIGALAKKLQSTIFAGTVPVKCDESNRFQAVCRCFDPKGKEVASYAKIHLFDVSVEDNTGSYRESASTKPGDRVVVIDIQGVRVGVAVCYDVRFTGLFDAMGEVDLLVLPSAFTQKTGQAHWSTLVRARSIEKQCFAIAAGQVGTHENGRETYGHSMIVSPWGDTLAQKQNGPGIIHTKVDMGLCDRIRKAMPVHQHKKFRSHLVQSSGN